jgi:hypothetical protein
MSTFILLTTIYLLATIKKLTYSYVSMATIVRRSHHNVTIYVYYLSCSLATWIRHDRPMDIFVQIMQLWLKGESSALALLWGDEMWTRFKVVRRISSVVSGRINESWFEPECNSDVSTGLYHWVRAGEYQPAQSFVLNSNEEWEWQSASLTSERDWMLTAETREVLWMGITAVSRGSRESLVGTRWSYRERNFLEVWSL